MSVSSVGQFQNILKNHNAKKWTAGSELKIGNNLNITDAPKIHTPGTPSKSFGEVLADSLGKVNNLQIEANKAMQELATGKAENIHETLLQVEKAEIAFKQMNQIRLKVIDAYREVMKMQV